MPPAQHSLPSSTTAGLKSICLLNFKDSCSDPPRKFLEALQDDPFPPERVLAGASVITLTEKVHGLEVRSSGEKEIKERGRRKETKANNNLETIMLCKGSDGTRRARRERGIGGRGTPCVAGTRHSRSITFRPATAAKPFERVCRGVKTDHRPVRSCRCSFVTAETLPLITHNRSSQVTASPTPSLTCASPQTDRTR